MAHIPDHIPLIDSFYVEWASGDRTSLVRWSNTNTGKSIYHEIELQNPKQNVEIANQAQDGKVYYAISTVSPLPETPSTSPVIPPNIGPVANQHHMANRLGLDYP